jgi:hypothetical protein
MRVLNYLLCNILLVESIITCAKQAFVIPDLNRRYDQVCWVVSHNAPFSKAHDYIYFNQNLSLTDQIKKADTFGFELDIEKRSWGKTIGIFGSSGTNISLCHESCKVNKFLQPRASGLLEPTGDPLSLQYALKIIKQFLMQSPSAIFTITLENRVVDYKDVDREFETAGLQDMILKPTDWNINEKQGWPTLDWMIKNNKRLVVFNDKSAKEQNYTAGPANASTKYTFNQWIVMVQNQWGGAQNVEIARKERVHSAAVTNTIRYLYEFDWFPPEGKIIGGISSVATEIAGWFKKRTPFGGDMRKVNGPDLEKGLNTIVNEGLTTGRAKGRYPNFIKIDFVDEGDAVAIANRINRMANDENLRKTMFAPIP